MLIPLDLSSKIFPNLSIGPPIPGTFSKAFSKRPTPPPVTLDKASPKTGTAPRPEVAERTLPKRFSNSGFLKTLSLTL